MKKTVLALVLSTLAFGAVAQQSGGFSGPQNTGVTNHQGGFSGPSQRVTTVTQAKSLRDDAWVVLEGNIVQRVGDELYEFRDNTGTVNVDIDDDRWRGMSVGPNDKVRIEGEVDKDWNSLEIDVKTIQRIK